MSAADMTQTIKTLALNVRLSCQLLGVPESSYYERINRRRSKTQLRRQHLAIKIVQLFKANRGIYGAPKIQHLLLNQGEKVGLNLVQKIMKQLQIKSVVVKKFKPGHSVRDGIKRKNLIQNEPTKKNKVWSTDITYIPTQQGWAYLSTIMDRYTKKVIAWDLDKRMTVELVQRTLIKALESQNYPEAVILHSDQGSQYTSHEYEETIKNSGLTHSFSRKGYPYHNASLESWHGHLKREWVYQFKYKNFEEAYQSIFWYIEAFYNSKRIHQSLGYLTPNQFEKGIA
ncbi:transposase [Lactococcus paracarnosus]|uniref:Transposase n=1 Tax=Pseudolactococcus paracarnosus TaxID=2749962 RepID=A0A7L4WEA5_9LACT|nr:transposase [Lactococcus paracarnosus]QDJ27891.1 transposase [Lactococcus paracarnosus]QDJ27965.1 transposase [Lactococcus paracarnosus]QDJ28211.1 transposase [Lactococcus paracarnosus]